MALPLDLPTQQYVTVSAMAAGFFELPDREVFADSLETITAVRVPSFVFLIVHPKHGKLLFDLGVRKNAAGYPPAMKGELVEMKVECNKDAADLLTEGGVSVDTIKSVILSHLHFDHHGDPSLFKNADIVVGKEAAEAITRTYPQIAHSRLPEFPTEQQKIFIEYDISVGPFRAFDYFKDGSMYLLDTPGHYPGHLAALLRVGANKFVLLAGDCCHNRQCYTTPRLISPYNYEDLETARATVENLKILSREPNVIVILAHEVERLNEMPLFPNCLNEWATTP